MISDMAPNFTQLSVFSCQLKWISRHFFQSVTILTFQLLLCSHHSRKALHLIPKLGNSFY